MSTLDFLCVCFPVTCDKALLKAWQGWKQTRPFAWEKTGRGIGWGHRGHTAKCLQPPGTHQARELSSKSLQWDTYASQDHHLPPLPTSFKQADDLISNVTAIGLGNT